MRNLFCDGDGKFNPKRALMVTVINSLLAGVVISATIKWNNLGETDSTIVLVVGSAFMCIFIGIPLYGAIKSDPDYFRED